jgi:catechol 2,3-dioxygenase-like lactoylglutathione lyase family enzyme
MVLNHVGIVNESEEKAVRFYADFLGLEKTREFIVAAGLSEQLFSVSRQIKVLVFESQGIKVEVFICSDCLPPSPDFRHIGFLVEDFPGILEKARRSGVEVIEGRAGEKIVYFLRDFSGNLIEIKAQ